MLSKEDPTSKRKSDIICEEKRTLPDTLNLNCKIYIDAAELYTLRGIIVEEVLESLYYNSHKDTLYDVDKVLK